MACAAAPGGVPGRQGALFATETRRRARIGRGRVAVPSQASRCGNNVVAASAGLAVFGTKLRGAVSAPSGPLLQPQRAPAVGAVSLGAMLHRAGRCPAVVAILQRNKNEKTAAPAHDMQKLRRAGSRSANLALP